MEDKYNKVKSQFKSEDPVLTVEEVKFTLDELNKKCMVTVNKPVPPPPKKEEPKKDDTKGKDQSAQEEKNVPNGNEKPAEENKMETE